MYFVDDNDSILLSKVHVSRRNCSECPQPALKSPEDWVSQTANVTSSGTLCVSA